MVATAVYRSLPSHRFNLRILCFKTSTIRHCRHRVTRFMSDDASRRGMGEFKRPRLRDWLRQVLLKPRIIRVPRWISPQHYNVTISELCGHASFTLVAISYAVDDFLHLRILAVAGSTVMLCFTYFHPHGRILWLPFKWNALFIAINTYRIGKVLADRYFAEQLPHEVKRARDEHLYIMDPPDFAQMYRIARVQSFKAGDLITTQGEMNPYIRFILSGELDVLRDGMVCYILQEGNFMAECGLHAGLLLPGQVESCCTVVAKTDCQVLCWERSSLVELLHRDSVMRRALKAILSWDIVSKLKGQRELLTSGVVTDPDLWTRKRTEQSQHRYAAILHNCLSHPRYMNKRKEELRKLRLIHHIDDAYHERALKSCGWTVSEFEQGFKEGEEHLLLEDEDLDHDWKWHMNDIVLRLLG